MPRTKIEPTQDSMVGFDPDAESLDIDKNDPLPRSRINIDSAYKQWSEGLNLKTDFDKIVEAAKPDIEKAMTAYAGTRSPAIEQRARILVSRAIKSYNPKDKSSLRSWIYTQLQPLRRYARQLDPIPVPERLSRQIVEIQRAEQDFIDNIGRYPSTAELADSIGLSIKSIEKIRSFQRANLSEQALPEDSPGVTVNETKDNTWVEMVYQSLNSQEQIVMEYRLGLHGKPTLSPGEIAKKLRLSPGRISQISNRIADQLESPLKDTI